MNTLMKPGAKHLLGTDTLGRDLLTRIMYGSRIALLVGVLTTMISATLGTVIGLFCRVLWAVLFRA